MTGWKLKQKKKRLKSRRLYTGEIFSDFQTRTKIFQKQLKNVPDAILNHVGMETINPKSHPGKYFVEFASCATIHGLNHLVAPHRHPIEKFLASVFILGALVALVSLSFYSWWRYQDDASVLVIQNDRDNFKINRPSYYVCPLNNMKTTNVSEIFKSHGVEPTPETESFFRFLVNVTYDTMQDTPGFDRVPSSKWLGLLHDLRQEVPPHSLVIGSLHPEGKAVVTERGVCTVFRSNVADYHTYEYWKTNNFTMIPLPKDIPYYDYNSHSEQESIKTAFPFHVSYFDPNDVIEYRTRFHTIELLMVDWETVSLLQFTTSANTKELSIRQRKCKFYTDGGLKTWPVYARNMCVIECRMEIIQEKCGCRPHFARPIENIPVCDAQQLRCIGDIKQHLFLAELVPAWCDCLFNCNGVTYVNVHSFITELTDVTPTNDSNFHLNVEFPTVAYHGIVLFSFNDFLTSIGGSAGLFLGASVLSFVEIFYYATLRMCVYVRSLRATYRKKQRRVQFVKSFS